MAPARLMWKPGLCYASPLLLPFCVVLGVLKAVPHLFAVKMLTCRKSNRWNIHAVQPGMLVTTTDKCFCCFSSATNAIRGMSQQLLHRALINKSLRLSL